ncbi:MAG: TIGR03013 family PEP-CTERM/XrtA system glycosyltransferase [Gammaproteobacteria bacterium]|nr:TIGR03013 family PEP-CTERM/XrtA system glycosyltransferase [Gammaproteobacteria bacterium]
MRVRVLGQYVPASLAVLAIIEALLCFLALYAAVCIRFQVGVGGLPELVGQFGPLWPRGIAFSAIVVTSLLAFGLYNSRQRTQLSGMLARLLLALLVSACVFAALFYVFPSRHLFRGVAALAVILAVCAVLTSRLIFARVADEDIFKRRVLVYGAGYAAAAITRLRRAADRHAFTLLGFVQPPGEERAVPDERLLRYEGDLCALSERLGVTEVVVAMDDRRRGFPIPELLDCRLAGIDVTELLTFLERETGRVHIDVLNPSWMIFSQGFKRDPFRLFSSRALDLLASVGVLVVALPAMVLTFLAIKIEDGWQAPALYRQARVGLGGQIFKVVKFRSMRQDAELNGAQWAQHSDPRVTRVGAIIRKLRIDELPQVFNVLRGHMSFVGPRPERPEFVAQLAEKIPYYVQRHCVKPGITGWAQLCYPYGSSESDALEKLQYDLYYIKNNSLLFDLAILIQTAEVVLFGKGAR